MNEHILILKYFEHNFEMLFYHLFKRLEMSSGVLKKPEKNTK